MHVAATAATVVMVVTAGMAAVGTAAGIMAAAGTAGITAVADGTVAGEGPIGGRIPITRPPTIIQATAVGRACGSGAMGIGWCGVLGAAGDGASS